MGGHVNTKTYGLGRLFCWYVLFSFLNAHGGDKEYYIIPAGQRCLKFNEKNLSHYSELLLGHEKQGLSPRDLYLDVGKVCLDKAIEEQDNLKSMSWSGKAWRLHDKAFDLYPHAPLIRNDHWYVDFHYRVHYAAFCQNHYPEDENGHQQNYARVAEAADELFVKSSPYRRDLLCQTLALQAYFQTNEYKKINNLVRSLVRTVNTNSTSYKDYAVWNNVYQLFPQIVDHLAHEQNFEFMRQWCQKLFENKQAQISVVDFLHPYARHKNPAVKKEMTAFLVVRSIESKNNDELCTLLQQYVPENLHEQDVWNRAKEELKLVDPDGSIMNRLKEYGALLLNKAKEKLLKNCIMRVDNIYKFSWQEATEKQKITEIYRKFNQGTYADFAEYLRNNKEICFPKPVQMEQLLLAVEQENVDASYIYILYCLAQKKYDQSEKAFAVLRLSEKYKQDKHYLRTVCEAFLQNNAVFLDYETVRDIYAAYETLSGSDTDSTKCLSSVLKKLVQTRACEDMVNKEKVVEIMEDLRKKPHQAIVDFESWFLQEYESIARYYVNNKQYTSAAKWLDKIQDAKAKKTILDTIIIRAEEGENEALKIMVNAIGVKELYFLIKEHICGENKPFDTLENSVKIDIIEKFEAAIKQQCNNEIRTLLGHMYYRMAEMTIDNVEKNNYYTKAWEHNDALHWEASGPWLYAVLQLFKGNGTKKDIEKACMHAVLFPFLKTMDKVEFFDDMYMNHIKKELSNIRESGSVPPEIAYVYAHIVNLVEGKKKAEPLFTEILNLCDIPPLVQIYASASMVKMGYSNIPFLNKQFIKLLQSDLTVSGALWKIIGKSLVEFVQYDFSTIKPEVRDDLISICATYCNICDDHVSKKKPDEKKCMALLKEKEKYKTILRTWFHFNSQRLLEMGNVREKNDRAAAIEDCNELLSHNDFHLELNRMRVNLQIQNDDYTDKFLEHLHAYITVLSRSLINKQPVQVADVSCILDCFDKLFVKKQNGVGKDSYNNAETLAPLACLMMKNNFAGQDAIEKKWSSTLAEIYHRCALKTVGADKLSGNQRLACFDAAIKYDEMATQGKYSVISIDKGLEYMRQGKYEEAAGRFKVLENICAHAYEHKLENEQQEARKHLIKILCEISSTLNIDGFMEDMSLRPMIMGLADIVDVFDKQEMIPVNYWALVKSIYGDQADAVVRKIAAKNYGELTLNEEAKSLYNIARILYDSPVQEWQKLGESWIRLAAKMGISSAISFGESKNFPDMHCKESSAGRLEDLFKQHGYPQTSLIDFMEKYADKIISQNTLLKKHIFGIGKAKANAKLAKRLEQYVKQNGDTYGYFILMDCYARGCAGFKKNITTGIRYLRKIVDPCKITDKFCWFLLQQYISYLTGLKITKGEYQLFNECMQKFRDNVGKLVAPDNFAMHLQTFQKGNQSAKQVESCDIKK